MFTESKAGTSEATHSVLKNVHLIRLSAAQFASMAATYAIFFASVVLIEEITRSSTLMGVMMFSLSLPGFIFGMLAGVWIDRHDRRRALIIGSLLCLLSALGYSVGTRLLRSEPLLLLTIFLSNFMLSALMQFTASARDAALPQAVEPEQLLAANSVLQVAMVCAQGVGTVVLAPMLYHAGGAPTVGWVGLVLFTLAAWGYMRLPSHLGVVIGRDEGKHTGAVWEELRAGWRFIVGKPVVRSAIAYLVLMSGLILVIMTLLPGLVSRAWDFPVEQMPLLAVPGGIGFGLSVLLIGRFGTRFQEEDWLGAGLFALGCGLASMPLIRELSGPSVVFFTLMAVISGGGAAMVVIPARTLLQERSPDAMRGRVTSTQLFLSNALSTAPLPILGGLADLFGVKPMFTFLGLFLMGVAVFGLWRSRKEGVTSEPSPATVDVQSVQSIADADTEVELDFEPEFNLAVAGERESSGEQGERRRLGRIAIVTDSASNLPADIVDQYDIAVVPICLHWDADVYRDGIDISPDEVYQRLRHSSRLPKTAAPSVGDFLRTYLRLSTEVEAIVSIHLPDRLSGVIAAARLAANIVEEKVPVYVVDAGTAAMGAGFVALAAARAAERGFDVDAIQRVADEIRRRVYVFAMLDTLEYLHRGGRIGKAEALLGIALQIKPILFLNNGVVDVLAKPRTVNRAVQIMLDEMEKCVEGRPVHVAVLHADAPDYANNLREIVAARFDCIEIFTCAFTPVMGVHAGPGVIGLAFYAEEE